VLSLREVRLRRGTQVLLESASLTIASGEKVGIVGRNGSGKSSLLALIGGTLAPDAGEYSAPARLALAAVSQELPETPLPLIEYLLDGDLELRAIERALAAAEQAGDGMHQSALHAEYEAAGGYGARARAAELARGVGFAPGDLERSLAQFSGGMQMRANLARALMRRSDVLLLDEPTNHLDLDAVLWLETWLARYRGTLLLVSHDRELLDGVVSRIVQLAGASLRAYTGNYSAFEVQSAAERARTEALAARRRRQVERITAFVARFRATASKARQAQSRLKRLARLETVEAAYTEEGFEWQFAPPAKLPRPLVALDEASVGYAGRAVLQGASLSVAPGERLGVLGRNGAGKSTLMRLLAGELALRSGERTAAPDLECGFFAQIELERFRREATPLGELARLGGPAAGWTAQQLRDHLGLFGFRDARVFEPVERFSGGERARLGLAVLVARRPNLLLLDEPTNHLDLSARHALMLALQDFAGAVVVVSHDRALLAELCDRFVLVADGAVQPFDGDLQDYARWLAQSAAAHPQPADPRAAEAAPSRRTQRRLEAEERNRLSGVRAELASAEGELTALAARRLELERALADPELYAPGRSAEQQQLAQEHRTLMRQIEALEGRWLELGERLERAT
jgi:ATP-binding cassette, subfamily F, member 3